MFKLLVFITVCLSSIETIESYGHSNKLLSHFRSCFFPRICDKLSDIAPTILLTACNNTDCFIVIFTTLYNSAT